MPPLFYFPRGKEIELLKILSNKVPRSGKEFEDISKNYENELERLQNYHLINIEQDETGISFRIKITNKELWAYEYLKELG